MNNYHIAEIDTIFSRRNLHVIGDEKGQKYSNVKSMKYILH